MAKVIGAPEQAVRFRDLQLGEIFTSNDTGKAYIKGSLVGLSEVNVRAINLVSGDIIPLQDAAVVTRCSRAAVVMEMKD